MRSATRVLLSLSASLALIASTVGAVAAVSSPGAGAALSNAQVMGTFHSAHGSHGKPTRTKNKNLSFGGGSVETTPVVYISFWGTDWNTGFSTGGYTSAQAQTYIQNFFTSVGGSSWNKVVAQYCQNVPTGTQDCSLATAPQYIDTKNATFGGSWVDTHQLPGHPKQSDIAQAAERLAVATGGVKPNATYMVFTPHGKSMRGFGTQWCAWHSSTTYSGKNLAYAYIPYIPDAGAACGMNFVNSSNNSYGNGYFDGFSIVAGHEYSEAETDPFPSNGWVDGSGAENADKCAWNSLSNNISLGGHYYAVQPTWSNSASDCAMSG